MAGGVKLIDNSIQVKTALNDTAIAWLYTWSNEIASHARRNCQMDGNVGTQLRGSYTTDVDASAGEAKIGSPLEAAYWEEYGTGSHADTQKNGGKQGRKDWWVYVADQPPREKESTHYKTQIEAEAVAQSMRAEGFDAHASNGRDPQYTLEKAFKATKPKAIADLKEQLKEELG